MLCKYLPLNTREFLINLYLFFNENSFWIEFLLNSLFVLPCGENSTLGIILELISHFIPPWEFHLGKALEVLWNPCSILLMELKIRSWYMKDTGSIPVNLNQGSFLFIFLKKIFQLFSKKFPEKFFLSSLKVPQLLLQSFSNCSRSVSN